MEPRKLEGRSWLVDGGSSLLRISEILHPLTCSCEVDVVSEKDGGVVELEASRVELEACRVVELEACRVDVVSTK